MTLIARPTTYNGIKMRSRLEAHFAAFLDRASFRWEYEPRAFASEDGQYLPDFLVRNAGPLESDLYVETKGACTTRESATVAGRMEIIFASDPLAALAIIAADWMLGPRHQGLVHPGRGWEWTYGGVGIARSRKPSFWALLDNEPVAFLDDVPIAAFLNPLAT